MPNLNYRATSSFSLQIYFDILFFILFFIEHIFDWISNWHVLSMINHYLVIFNWKWLFWFFDIWFLKSVDIWFLEEKKRSSVKFVLKKKYSEKKKRRHQTPKTTISSICFFGTCFSAPKYNFQQHAFEKKSNLFHTIKNHGEFKFWMNMNFSSVFTGH